MVFFACLSTFVSQALYPTVAGNNMLVCTFVLVCMRVQGSCFVRACGFYSWSFSLVYVALACVCVCVCLRDRVCMC